MTKCYIKHDIFPHSTAFYLISPFYPSIAKQGPRDGIIDSHLPALIKPRKPNLSWSASKSWRSEHCTFGIEYQAILVKAVISRVDTPIPVRWLQQCQQFQAFSLIVHAAHYRVYILCWCKHSEKNTSPKAMQHFSPWKLLQSQDSIAFF